MFSNNNDARSITKYGFLVWPYAQIVALHCTKGAPIDLRRPYRQLLVERPLGLYDLPHLSAEHLGVHEFENHKDGMKIKKKRDKGKNTLMQSKKADIRIVSTATNVQHGDLVRQCPVLRHAHLSTNCNIKITDWVTGQPARCYKNHIHPCDHHDASLQFVLPCLSGVLRQMPQSLQNVRQAHSGGN